ncbi:MAG: DUF1844 domain-containing protein [Myxococcales bacterium]|nr:DUF1844 domain-containing protein [Myxococcales bacterium]
MTDQSKTKKSEGSSIDFSGFVLSLAQSAAIDLGDAPHKDTGKVERDLPQAKQTIDILHLLRAKTQGNLDGDETRLLDGLLYQLQISFVEAQQLKK